MISKALCTSLCPLNLISIKFVLGIFNIQSLINIDILWHGVVHLIISI